MNKQAEHFLSTLDRSDNTIRTYRQALETYFSIVSDDLSDSAYERFLAGIKHYSPSSKRVMCSAVMKLYKFCKIGSAEERKELNEQYLKKVRTKPVSFDREAVEKIILYCDTLRKNLTGWRDRAFVLTMADSGFRISELCSVMRDDIDWLNRRIPIIGKGDKPALVRLSKRSSEAIMDYLQARDMEEWNATGTPEPLFSQHDNLKQMTPDGMRKSVKNRMKEAGAKKVRIHDFRHYFVTITLLGTGKIKVAKELARHESIKTTDRYSHLDNEELDKAYNEVFNK